MFECVINISEGRDVAVLDALSAAAGSSLRDRHHDIFHHRSVFTLINEPEMLRRDVQSLLRCAYEHLSLSGHQGVHPRFGVVDVVPFVALNPAQADGAVALRDQTARFIGETFCVPAFLYGELSDHAFRTLPEIRKRAFKDLAPDAGPAGPSPTLGAVAVGARSILVAWNLWLTGVTLDQARAIASAIRQPAVRSLAFTIGSEVQISCNIVDTDAVRLSTVYDHVAAQLPEGGRIEHSELVGLLPVSMLGGEDESRWSQLGLSREATIEARCRQP